MALMTRHGPLASMAKPGPGVRANLSDPSASSGTSSPGRTLIDVYSVHLPLIRLCDVT